MDKYIRYIPVALMLVLFSSVSESAIQSYSIFINNDHINTGQCSVNTVSGIDYKVVVVLDDSSLVVQGVAIENCSVGKFLAPESLLTSNWAASLSEGSNSSIILEGMIPKKILGNPTNVGLIFTSSDGSGGFSDIVSNSGNSGSNSGWFYQEQQSSQLASPIPTLSEVSLIILVLIMTCLPFILKKGGYLDSNIFVVIFIFPFLSMSFIALAAVVTIDGKSLDWPASSLLASDDLDDQTGNTSTDILNVYTFEDRKNLYVRLDLSQQNSLNANSISGMVGFSQISTGAEVYVGFSDGTFSEKIDIEVDGSYKLLLTNEDLEKINPKIIEGFDGDKDDVQIFVTKNGRKLRSGMSHDLSKEKAINISVDTEAYAQFLEIIGEYSVSALTEFSRELDDHGYIKENSDYYSLIKSIRPDIDNYFISGLTLPSNGDIFTRAISTLGKNKLAELSDNNSYVTHREHMSGGDVVLPSNITVKSNDIAIFSKGNGRFTIGDGEDSEKTIYLEINDNGIYKLIPINIRERKKVFLSSGIISSQKGGVIGAADSSISINIPPFSLLSNKKIDFNIIKSEGETSDGKIILEMLPSGLKFDLPITVKVKYGDFNVTDPNTVEWKYGSIISGYKDADIVNIDKNSGFIYLNIEHFSNLIVKKIKGQKYLDLGHHSIVVTPRRDHATLYKNLIKGKRTYITNKLFSGASISNFNTEGYISGGQCVQYAKYLHYPIKYGVVGLYYGFAGSSQAKQIAVKIRKDIISIKSKLGKEEYFKNKGIRKSASECKKDDILLMNFHTSTGHIAILERDVKLGDKNISVINSNWFPFTHKSKKIGSHMFGESDKPPYRYSSYGWHNERFGIDDIEKKYGITSGYSLSLTRDTYLCLANPDVNGDGVYTPKNGDEGALNYISFISGEINASPYRTIFDNESRNAPAKYNTAGLKVTHQPWMYYLLDTKGDGVSITNEKKSGATYYGYEPDILPVASLKLNDDYQLTTDIESRYEIYVSDVFVNNFRLTKFSNYESNELEKEKNIIKTDTSLSFSGNKLKKLKQKTTNKTEFKLIPKNGIENFKSRNELRTVTKDKNVDTKKKVLFSPNVIDDYYINWSSNNKYDTSKILIGFWNSNGYNMPLQNKNEILPNKLLGDSIYKSSDAINGYFMTLSDNKSAEWHFSLAGIHAIFVHVPTGKYSDIKNAKYEYKDIKGTTHILKVKNISKKLEDSGFKNWFILYEEKGSDKKYGFNLGGSEVLKVTADGGIVVVDAVRLQGKSSLIEDTINISGSVTLSDKDDVNDIVIKVKFVDENGKNIGETCTNPSDINNINYDLDREDGLGDKIFAFFIPTAYAPDNECFNNFTEKEKKSRIISHAYKSPGSSSSPKIKRVISHKKIAKQKVINTFLSYKPSKVTIDISGSNDNIKLPKIILQKNKFVEDFIFNIKNVDGTPLDLVNLDIKHGIGNDSELVVYTGVTNNLGKFMINNLAYGQYTAVLSLPSYTPKIINFTVSDDQFSINETLVTATGGLLEGIWIASSNHVPSVASASYKNSIKIEKYGNNYRGSYKSVYRWNPDEDCGMISSVLDVDFIATKSGNDFDLTITTDSGDTQTFCEDGSWVSAGSYSKGDTIHVELNSNDSGILSINYDICGWSQEDLGCIQNMPLFYKTESNILN